MEIAAVKADILSIFPDNIGTDSLCRSVSQVILLNFNIYNSTNHYYTNKLAEDSRHDQYPAQRLSKQLHNIFGIDKIYYTSQTYRQYTDNHPGNTALCS